MSRSEGVVIEGSLPRPRRSIKLVVDPLRRHADVAFVALGVNLVGFDRGPNRAAFLVQVPAAGKTTLCDTIDEFDEICFELRRIDVRQLELADARRVD